MNSFRGLDGLDLPTLTQVNVVTGTNGVGKTSLLEALWLFTGRYDSSLIWNPQVQRSSVLPDDPVAPLTSNGHMGFVGRENGKAYEQTVEFIEFSNSAIDGSNSRDTHFADESNAEPLAGHLIATVNGEELPRHRFRQTSLGLVATAFKAAHRNPCFLEGAMRSLKSNESELRRFSDVTEAGYMAELSKALSLIHPEIVDLEILVNELGPYVSGRAKDGRRYPLEAFGGGVTRLCRLFLAMFSCRNSVVLIDEIENGVHHTVLADVWRSIANLVSDLNVQMFVTTYSVECLHAAIEAFRTQEQKLTVHNLHRRDDEIRTAMFSGETLQGAQELGIELR